MDHYDSVDRRLSALAEWLKSSANNDQDPQCVDVDVNKLYQNHVTYFYHPYANFAGEYANNNGFATTSNKPQRERTTFTESHLRILEQCFIEVKHPDTNRREKLAIQLGLPVKTIQIWFQNRRARERKGVKGKRNGDENSGNLSGQEDDHNTIFNSGFTDYDIVKNAVTDFNQRLTLPGLGSTTSEASLESCTTTVVEEIDSSKQYENRSNQNTIQNDEQFEEEFAIIHIPEQQLKQNANKDVFNPIGTTTADTEKSLNDNCKTIDEKLVNYFSTDLTEQRFASYVDNLDLDLIVKTYEVLQSKENVDVLIENWLTDCSGHQEQLTLEENLKSFIEYSQKSSINA